MSSADVLFLGIAIFVSACAVIGPLNELARAMHRVANEIRTTREEAAKVAEVRRA